MSSIYAANTWPQDCRPSPRRSASTLRYCTERRRSCGLDPRRVGDRAHRIVCRPGPARAPRRPRAVVLRRALFDCGLAADLARHSGRRAPQLGGRGADHSHTPVEYRVRRDQSGRISEILQPAIRWQGRPMSALGY